ncbi:MAG: hypothetical protein JWQ09_3944 [Segetibacter sp.]|nr:hypothetical protein [Segetibacter sp.]
MASKKHRPIVMNRNKRPGRTYKILKKAILITALLAFIEIIILVVIHFKNANKAVVKTQVKPKEMPKVAVSDTPKVAAVIPSEVMSKNEQKDTVAKKDTTEIIKPPAEVIKPPVEKAPPKPKKPVKDTSVIPATMPKEVKIAKNVSSEEMFQILNDIRLEKSQANNPAKCISIQIIDNSNAENGFRIANYLRKNGYVISGREVIQGSQKGIQINATGPCIKLTVGDL